MLGKEETERIYRKLGHDSETIDHVLRVRKLCKAFIKSGITLNKELLLSAAALHDIAKSLEKHREDDKHHKKKKIEEALRKTDTSPDDLPKGVFKVIDAHRASFNPGEVRLEAAILRICDKLDKFNKICNKKNKRKAFSKAVDACNSSMERITEYFIEEHDDRVYMFYCVYAQIHSRLMEKIINDI